MSRTLEHSRPSLNLVLLIFFLFVLWLAGGASRSDALGQVVVRSSAWFALCLACLMDPRLPFVSGRRLPLVLLLAAVALVLMQLIPLPPELWLLLPPREKLAPALSFGAEQAWRPLTIVPGATVNAASSLIVPFVTWILLSRLSKREREWLPAMMLTVVVASAVLGLLQLSGVVLDNIFVNDTPGAVAGTFANRNHFALLLAMGCLLAPAWSLLEPQGSRWRMSLAWGLALLFFLTILGSGSRAGLGLSVVAIALAAALSWRVIQSALAGRSRWVLISVVGGFVCLAGALTFLSFAADRAASINRLFAADGAQDIRFRALPVVLAMAKQYILVGSGLGTFEVAFRIEEPLELLKPTVFNHAHNDFLEVLVDGGLPAALVMGAAIGWWSIASLRMWRTKLKRPSLLARLGSGLLLLILLASLVDYPARTPIIMAIVMMSSFWLADAAREMNPSALPHQS